MIALKKHPPQDPLLPMALASSSPQFALHVMLASANPPLAPLQPIHHTLH